MFMTRLISGIVLVALALAVILTGGYVLAAVLLFLAVVAYRELMKACGLAHVKEKINGLEIIGYTGIAVYYFLLVFVENKIFLLLVLITILVGFMFLYVFTFPKYRAEQIMCAFFCVAYAPVMLSFIYLVRILPYGIYTVWMIFISSWICDTCAYAVGMLFGKHKLAPILSPKKSIEGALGGVLGSAIVGAVYAYFVVESVVMDQKVTWIFVLISAVGAVVSQVGDLAASAIKRNHEIKDYGKLIPGHGGVMDRFDSVIFTAPMIYFLTLILIHG
ncbi:MAG: phosphatidate cytidylyltransferase [Lachnospiraceae bacterium]|nr:phosphatidate cytidylyltransferase [Lachnospiraceae bacterium]GFI01965.1 phosphatidate cytidylyltransferase [Lachnospiraceae bacterium]